MGTFVNFRTEKDPEEKSLAHHLKMGKKRQGTSPPEELYKLENHREEKKVEQAKNFDQIINSQMGVRFGQDEKIYHNLSELKVDQKLKRDFGLSEFDDSNEVELSDSEEKIDEQKFERQTGFNLAELEEDEQQKQNLMEDFQELEDEKLWGSPSDLEVEFEEG
ncbi:MAG: hypothetical protein ACKKMS_02495 [Candidatus Nealsonbacteria bacterium]